MKGSPSSHQDFKKLIPKDNLFLPLLYVQYSEHKDPSKIFEQLGNDERKFEIFKKYARKILMVLGNNPEKLAQFKEYVQELARNNKQNHAPLPLSAFSEEEKALFFPIIDKLAFKQIEPHEVFDLLNRDDAVLERFKLFGPSLAAERVKHQELEARYRELEEKERQSKERLRGFQAEHERLQQNIIYNYQMINEARKEVATKIAKHLPGVSISTSSPKARVI